jgi:ribonuclease HII
VVKPIFVVIFNAMLLPYYQPNILEAGVDEAGRGCYAGPVFAAAVILPNNFKNNLLNDSKKLTPTQRNQLRTIIEFEAIAYAVHQISHTQIDAINILQATYQAMHGAIKALKPKAQYLLIDGNRFLPYPKLPHSCIVKGDGLYNSIAAASILAKTHRDDYMQRLHQQYPMYGWQSNKGYGTLTHRNAIAKYGLSPHHRKSFNIFPVQQKLF